MRRFWLMVLVAACLLPEIAVVQAQGTVDQMNKLSLEALTTPAPGGNPGRSYGHRSTQRSFYHRLSGRRSFRSRGGYVRTSSALRYRARVGSYRSVRHSGHGIARRGGYGSVRHRAYSRGSYVPARRHVAVHYGYVHRRPHYRR